MTRFEFDFEALKKASKEINDILVKIDPEHQGAIIMDVTASWLARNPQFKAKAQTILAKQTAYILRFLREGREVQH